MSQIWLRDGYVDVNSDNVDAVTRDYLLWQQEKGTNVDAYFVGTMSDALRRLAGLAPRIFTVDSGSVRGEPSYADHFRSGLSNLGLSDLGGRLSAGVEAVVNPFARLEGTAKAVAVVAVVGGAVYLLGPLLRRL